MLHSNIITSEPIGFNLCINMESWALIGVGGVQKILKLFNRFRCALI